LELRRINGCFVDSDFFAIARLESRSVLAFCYVDICIESVTTRKVDINFCTVVSSVMRKVDVDVCFGALMIGSAFFSNVDILSAARTVVMILFTSNVNFFLSKLTFPSDALFLW